MSDATPPFAFSQFVPGFDFLKNLADAAAATASTAAKNPAAGGIAGAAAGAIPGMPSLSSWVAPTISVEEVDKRIQELKTVQYWLEQNGHALKATIQALEVQKMTLSTLRGMNVRMEDLASAFTRHATPPASASPFSAPPSAPAPAPSWQTESRTADADADADADANAETDAEGAAAGVVDPMQWWNALTDQFQQIATSAIHDAAQIKMPVMPAMPVMDKSAATRKKPASKTAGKTAAKPTAKAAAPRKRARGA